jgi:ATP-binding cassette subfamily F protein uup
MSKPSNAIGSLIKISYSLVIMSILCSLKNINLSYGQRKIFDQAEIILSQGDQIGLIGLNGQGKSTLFKILTGNVTPDHTSPPFIFDKAQDFSVFLVPQELEIESYKDCTIANYYLTFYPTLYQIHHQLDEITTKMSDGDYSEEILLQQEKLLSQFDQLGGWSIQSSYESYLKFFDLDEIHRPIGSLSGGEQRKMALSIGLSSTASLVLWDEPTNHLDIETIEKFEEEVKAKLKTYIIISHDRYLLNFCTNRIVHIERGKIDSFRGTYLDYLDFLEAREAELQKNLDKLQNKHRRELAWMRQGIKARGTRSKKRVEGYENIKKNIAELKSRSHKVVDLSLLHSGRKTKQLFEVKDAQIGYDNKVLINELNFIIAKKDKIALIGPNGAGKTTLLNVLQEKIPLLAGQLKAAEQLKVICFDQKRAEIDPNKTPLQIVGDGNDFISLPNGTRQHIHSYLEKFLFTQDQINRPSHTLSGGEKNRLQLAMFMSQSADIWIFDEPTNDLDLETIELLERELKSYESAFIIVGHDRAFLDNVCETTWLIHNQKLEIFEGGYSQVAPYIEALQLEKTLKEQSDQKKEKKTINNDQATLTKKQKNNSQKIEQIEQEIQKLELLIEQTKAELASFDFTNMNPQKQKKYDQAGHQLNTFEGKLSILYQEWEELQLKF